MAFRVMRNKRHSRWTQRLHEIFQVLDFDGEPCEHYENGRDDCIHSAVSKNTLCNIGCQTPYGPLDKSEICTEPEKARKAEEIFKEISETNITLANELCPKSCRYLLMSFGSFKDDFQDGNSHGYISISFEKFIKVSRSRYSYNALELLAEVGGYVGLFLGVSVNQFSDIIKSMVARCVSFQKRLLNARIRQTITQP